MGHDLYRLEILAMSFYSNIINLKKFVFPLFIMSKEAQKPYGLTPEEIVDELLSSGHTPNTAVDDHAL